MLIPRSITSGDLSHIDVIGMDFDLIDHANTGTPVLFGVLGEPFHSRGELPDFINTFEGDTVPLTPDDDTFAFEPFDDIHGVVPPPASAWGGMISARGTGAAYRLMRNTPSQR